MAKIVKSDKFEWRNSLKLSFTNFRGLRSIFVKCEFFIESNSLDILVPYERNLDDLIDSGIFSVRSYFFTHMHNVATSFCKEFISTKLCGFLLLFSASFTSFSVLLLFPLLSSSSSLSTVFDAIPSIIDEVLLINPSGNVPVFGDFNVDDTDRLTYSGEMDLVKSVIIFLYEMTLLRRLAFLIGSLTVTLTVLLFWMYFFLQTLVFVLQ